MIDRKWAREFAVEWIAAWNAHDLDRILSHYADDFEMRSPLIAERMGVASGLNPILQAENMFTAQHGFPD